MKGKLMWKMVAIPSAWAVAVIVSLAAGNPFALMVALVATAMMLFIEDARAAR
ncbi:hypothetical protein ACFL01_04925 [Planctomycetota bacterium]